MIKNVDSGVTTTTTEKSRAWYRLVGMCFSSQAKEKGPFFFLLFSPLFFFWIFFLILCRAVFFCSKTFPASRLDDIPSLMEEEFGSRKKRNTQNYLWVNSSHWQIVHLPGQSAIAIALKQSAPFLGCCFNRHSQRKLIWEKTRVSIAEKRKEKREQIDEMRFA